MNKYYFLLCSFPTLNIGVKPPLSFNELEKYLDWNLSQKDKEVLAVFRQYKDIKNLKNTWMEKKIDPRGNLDLKNINEVIQSQNFFPNFVFDFLKKYGSASERINNFAILEIQFLKYQINNLKNDFLVSYFTFEREIKLVSTALRAKLFNKDIANELKDEDQKDKFVENILSQKDSKTYHPPKQYEKLRKIFLKFKDNPKKLYKAFLEYCMEMYNNFVINDYFTINQILVYLASLFLVEDYYELNHEKGKLLVDKLL